MDKPISFLELMETEFPANRDWISTGILPRGGSMIMAGESKTGKSFFCLSACRSLACGEPFLEHPRMPVKEPCRVLYVEDEVKERGVQTRILEVFKDVDRRLLAENLFVLSNNKELRLDNPFGFAHLANAVRDIKPNVIVMDPIGRFIGAADENDNSKMGKVLDDLEGLLKRHQDREMALILSHHTRKPANLEIFDALSPHNMRGSSRFFANPDTILMLARATGTTGKNSAGTKKWMVEGRFETRQSEGFPGELLFSINREGDLRVRYEKEKGGPDGPPKLDPEIQKKSKPKPEQLKLAEV